MIVTISQEHTSKILDATRAAIGARIRGTAVDMPDDIPDIPARGVFVTLRVQGVLRGCIGFLEIRNTFAETLLEAARRAATEDSRFPSIEEHELEELQIEVTLLSAPERLLSPDDIVIGVHGLIAERQDRRGLLLPQVAVEQQWTSEEFLRGVCRKAQLPESAWEQEDTNLYRFRGLKLQQASHATDDAHHAKQEQGRI